MTREEIDAIFETDEQGKFIRLIVPSMLGYPEKNFIGRTRLELNIDEVVLVKKYAASLYSSI